MLQVEQYDYSFVHNNFWLLVLNGRILVKKDSAVNQGLEKGFFLVQVQEKNWWLRVQNWTYKDRRQQVDCQLIITL